MPRDADGFLKPDALRAGIPDQYAVVIAGVRHEVSLVHDRSRGGYVTRHKWAPEAGGDSPFGDLQWQYGEDLAAARKQFKSIVRSLGGRA